MSIENLINERDLLRNEYDYKGKFADLHIYGKNNHRIFLDSVKDMSGVYKIWGNYLIDKNNSLSHKKLYEGLQLDLFEEELKFKN